MFSGMKISRWQQTGATMAILASMGNVEAARLREMRRERDAGLALVEAARQRTCLGRTDGTNFGYRIYTALAVTPRLTDKGEK